MGVVGARQTPVKRPDPKQPQPLGSRFTYFLPTPVIRPGGLERTRALGSVAVVGPLLPASLVSGRALGNTQAGTPIPPALRMFHFGQRISTFWSQVADSRVFFFLPAREIAAPGLERERLLGAPLVRFPLFPAGLSRSRALGVLTVRIPDIPAPESLVRSRQMGAHLIFSGLEVELIPMAEDTLSLVIAGAGSISLTGATENNLTLELAIEED